MSKPEASWSRDEERETIDPEVARAVRELLEMELDRERDDE
jgi:hypothetical protein